MSDDFIDLVEIGEGCFASKDGTVIHYDGRNYFKSCGAIVGEHPDGHQKVCLKPIGHPGHIHEAYDGSRRRLPEDGGPDVELGNEKAPRYITFAFFNGTARMAYSNVAEFPDGFLKPGEVGFLAEVLDVKEVKSEPSDGS